MEKFVRQCLPCARNRPVNTKTLRGVLEKPRLFQMVSMDFIGPRVWDSKDVWIGVMLDHCSRYMVAQVFWMKPTAKMACMLLEERWIQYFGAPEAIVCDRGREFIGQEFRQVVLQKLFIMVVFTSPAFPQGNAMNESSHNVIEHTLTVRAAYQSVETLEELVQDAVMVYNASPHSALGQPPFYVVTGQDLVLPGLQRLTKYPTDKERVELRRQERFKTLMRHWVSEDSFQKVEESMFQLEDIVLYSLSDYERAEHAGHPRFTSMKNVPKWSSPCRIIKKR